MAQVPAEVLLEEAKVCLGGLDRRDPLGPEALVEIEGCQADICPEVEKGAHAAEGREVDVVLADPVDEGEDHIVVTQAQRRALAKVQVELPGAALRKAIREGPKAAHAGVQVDEHASDSPAVPNAPSPEDEAKLVAEMVANRLRRGLMGLLEADGHKAREDRRRGAPPDALRIR